MSAIVDAVRRWCGAHPWAILALCLAGCSGNSSSSQPDLKLRIQGIELLTESPQAGHPIEFRVTVRANEDTEDISFIYVLRSADEVDAEGNVVLPADSPS